MALMSYINPSTLLFRSRRVIETDQTVPLLSDPECPDNKTSIDSNEDEFHEPPSADDCFIGDIACEEAPSSNVVPNQDPPLRWTGISRVIQLVGRQSFYLYVGCLVLVIRLPFSLSIPHFVSATLGALGRADFATARFNIILLLIMGTIDAILDFWCVVLFGLTSLNIVKCLRSDLFSCILKQDMAFFDSSKSPDLASRLNSDCGAVGADLSWFFRFS
jgi:ABC-type bacteriocin/lantibiotic exporter with double-glycine peptidase domain